jgi:hypothetical protein
VSDPINVLVEHVLLTTRWGLAACAAEHCGWEDKFYPAKDLHSPLVPLHIRVSHARHQLDLLEEAVRQPYNLSQPFTPQGGW